jgi:hypothetical protein
MSPFRHILSFDGVTFVLLRKDLLHVHERDRLLGKVLDLSISPVSDPSFVEIDAPASLLNLATKITENSPSSFHRS